MKNQKKVRICFLDYLTAGIHTESNQKQNQNQIWCSDYSEPGDKHITRFLSLYLESRTTPGISASKL
jgi:hypothetical protein